MIQRSAASAFIAALMIAPIWAQASDMLHYESVDGVIVSKIKRFQLISENEGVAHSPDAEQEACGEAATNCEGGCAGCQAYQGPTFTARLSLANNAAIKLRNTPKFVRMYELPEHGEPPKLLAIGIDLIELLNKPAVFGYDPGTSVVLIALSGSGSVSAVPLSLANQERDTFEFQPSAAPKFNCRPSVLEIVRRMTGGAPTKIARTTEARNEIAETDSIAAPADKTGSIEKYLKDYPYDKKLQVGVRAVDPKHLSYPEMVYADIVILGSLTAVKENTLTITWKPRRGTKSLPVRIDDRSVAYFPHQTGTHRQRGTAIQPTGLANLMNQTVAVTARIGDDGTLYVVTLSRI